MYLASIGKKKDQASRGPCSLFPHGNHCLELSNGRILRIPLLSTISLPHSFTHLGWFPGPYRHWRCPCLSGRQKMEIVPSPVFTEASKTPGFFHLVIQYKWSLAWVCKLVQLSSPRSFVSPHCLQGILSVLLIIGVVELSISVTIISFRSQCWTKSNEVRSTLLLNRSPLGTSGLSVGGVIFSDAGRNPILSLGRSRKDKFKIEGPLHPLRQLCFFFLPYLLSTVIPIQT